MIFCRKTLYFPLQPVVIDDRPLSYSYSFKFLGLILDFKLNWKKHIQHVRSKLSSACGIIYQLRNNISMSISKTIYYSIAYPYLNYCCVVWSSAHNTHFQSLFSTQKRLIRIITKSGRRSESSKLFKQLKLLKLNDILEVNTLLFVYKSINNLIRSPIEFNEREVGPYNLRLRPPIQVPNHTSKQSERFVHIKGAKIWNDTPEYIRSSRTIYSFKKNIKKARIDSYV